MICNIASSKIVSAPSHCDKMAPVASMAASAELDLTLPIAILSTVTSLLVLALGILARTIKHTNAKMTNKAARMMTGIENDFKLYEDHEDCVKHIDTGHFVSSSVLV